MPRSSSVVAVVVVLAAGIAFGAEPAPPKAPPPKEAPPPKQEAPPAPEYERDIQSYFDKACLVCHLEGGINGGLILEQGVSYAALVNVAATGSKLKRVAPGDVEGSYLLHKLKGTHTKVGGKGARMPLGAPPSTPEQIAVVEAWIKAGAKPK